MKRLILFFLMMATKYLARMMKAKNIREVENWVEKFDKKFRKKAPDTNEN